MGVYTFVFQCNNSVFTIGIGSFSAHKASLKNHCLEHTCSMNLLLNEAFPRAIIIIFFGGAYAIKCDLHVNCLCVCVFMAFFSL